MVRRKIHKRIVQQKGRGSYFVVLPKPFMKDTNWDILDEVKVKLDKKKKRIIIF